MRQAPANQTQGVLFSENHKTSEVGAAKSVLYFIEVVSFESSNLNTLANK